MGDYDIQRTWNARVFRLQFTLDSINCYGKWVDHSSGRHKLEPEMLDSGIIEIMASGDTLSELYCAIDWKVREMFPNSGAHIIDYVDIRGPSTDFVFKHTTWSDFMDMVKEDD